MTQPGQSNLPRGTQLREVVFSEERGDNQWGPEQVQPFKGTKSNRLDFL